MPIRTIAVVVQDNFAMFEFGLACEAFGLDRTDDGIEKYDFRVCTPVPGEVTSSLGFSINVENDLTLARTADLVVISPRQRGMFRYSNPEVLDLVRAAVERDAWLLSVCTGSFVLAEAGVLRGRKATTHWMYSDMFAEWYPDVDLDADVLFVQDGRIITSAGTAAGIDACLHLLRQDLGAEKANIIARRMVVAPQRDGGQAQFITRPLDHVQSQSIGKVLDWAIDHLAEELTIEQLAARALMSPRTFARRFRAEQGATPAAWIARQRVIAAQRQLEQTDYALDQIAAECGFASAAVLRQNFARVLGMSPSAYRKRFSCIDETEASAQEVAA